MKKLTIFPKLAATLFCVLLISGCFGSPPVKTNIRDILTKAKDIGPVKYDSITTSLENGTYVNLTKHIWEEPPFMKLNVTGGQGYSVFIKRPEGIYVNIPGTNKFSRLNFTFPQPSLIEQSNELLTNISYRIVGNETVDGHTATVLQYEVSQTGGSITTKVWIWNDKGIPIETQITVVVGTRTASTTQIMNTNFVFGPIPVSEFDVT